MTRQLLGLLLVTLVTLVTACDGNIVDVADAATADSAVNDVSSDVSGDGGSLTLEGIPCAASDVIARRCIGCHADSPRFGAPMSLTSAGDFAALSRDPDKTVHVRASERIALEDDGRMPPPSQPPLSAEDRAALQAWLGAGAPPQSEATNCGDGPPPGPCQDPSCLPCTPDESIVVHGQAPGEPFAVPSGNPYHCVAFPSPFAPGQQATAWAPIVDDDRVLHHWILYRTATAQEPGVHDCNMPLDAVGVMGWAPGTEATVLPDDVGLELAQNEGEWLILQMHYWNVAGHEDARDASGVALCTTRERRAKTAGVLSLGTAAISLPPRAETEAVGLCPAVSTLLLSEPLQVIANTPHMHNLGRRIVSEVLRSGFEAETELLVDVDPWSFNDQRTHWLDEPVTIRPGDAIRTRCFYENTGSDYVFFGERTEDEMCFNFALVYPLEAFPAGYPRTCLTTLGL